MGEDLARVLALAGGRPVQVAQVVDGLEERGYALAVLLLSVPFVLPFPTLGLATPVGFALAAAGVSLALGRPPALPAMLRRQEIAYGSLERLVAAVQVASRRLGPLLRPRLGFMLGRRMRMLLGLSFACSALVLALPIPLPLSNFFPASALLLLAAGLLEGDGVLVLAGHAASVLVCGVLYLSWGVAWAFARGLLSWVS